MLLAMIHAAVDNTRHAMACWMQLPSFHAASCKPTPPSVTRWPCPTCRHCGCLLRRSTGGQWLGRAPRCRHAGQPRAPWAPCVAGDHPPACGAALPNAPLSALLGLLGGSNWHCRDASVTNVGQRQDIVIRCGAKTGLSRCRRAITSPASHLLQLAASCPAAMCAAGTRGTASSMGGAAIKPAAGTAW